MIQLSPHIKILVATKPIDFRKGVDSLVALCRGPLEQDPFSGTLFVFCNRSKTSLKMLCYDGQGFWLCQKRFSEGKINWWPDDVDVELQQLLAQQLSVLIYNGDPERANFAKEWKKIA
jgi:transposase